MISYWNGRFWGFSFSNPGLLFFSARVDSSNSEIPVGVAEECWPLVNTIPIPDTDGIGTGTCVVGSNLFALTSKGIYTVTGSNPASYQMQRVTSKGNGAYQIATCALPGEDTNSADVLVHAGNDRRVYFLFGAGGGVACSYPIQDQIDAPIASSAACPAAFVMLAVYHNEQGTYLLVGVRGQEGTHVYDVERQIWFNWNLGKGHGSSSGNYAMVEGLFRLRNRFFFAT